MAAKKGLIGEFLDFVKSGDLVSVASAFIIGAATAALVGSFTKNIALGILGLFTKCTDIKDATGAVTGQDCSGLVGKAWKSVGWGNFLNDAITYLFTMLVVFMIIKAYRKAVPDKARRRSERQRSADGNPRLAEDALTEGHWPSCSGKEERRSSLLLSHFSGANVRTHEGCADCPRSSSPRRARVRRPHRNRGRAGSARIVVGFADLEADRRARSSSSRRSRRARDRAGRTSRGPVAQLGASVDLVLRGVWLGSSARADQLPPRRRRGPVHRGTFGCTNVAGRSRT